MCKAPVRFCSREASAILDGAGHPVSLPPGASSLRESSLLIRWRCLGHRTLSAVGVSESLSLTRGRCCSAVGSFDLSSYPPAPGWLVRAGPLDVMRCLWPGSSAGDRLFRPLGSGGPSRCLLPQDPLPSPPRSPHWHPCPPNPVTTDPAWWVRQAPPRPSDALWPLGVCSCPVSRVSGTESPWTRHSCPGSPAQQLGFQLMVTSEAIPVACLGPQRLPGRLFLAEEF